MKLLVDGGTLVFGLDPAEFAYRRFVVVDGTRGEAMAGDRSELRVGDTVQVGRQGSSRSRASTTRATASTTSASSCRCDTGRDSRRRPGEVTSIGVTDELGAEPVARSPERLEARFPGIAAITEPGQAVKVDTASRLLISTGWIVSLLALIVGGIGVTNTMAMSVFERIREIGILRAVGWRTWRIAAMVVSEATAICLLALGGLAAASASSRRSSSSSGASLEGLIDPVYTAGTFAWGLAFALGVGLLGAVYPIWRAVSLTPIEALRRE